MIIPQTPEEAQEWIVNLCAQVVQLDSVARQMQTFAAEHYTEENRQAGNLVQGTIKDADGNEQLVTWTSDQLNKTIRAFNTAALLCEALNRKGADGKPLLAAFQVQIRPTMIRRPTPQ